MLTLAREASQLSQAELAGLVKTIQANVNRWEQGTQTVNEDSFTALLKALPFTAEFYTLQAELPPPTFYRKREKIAAKIMDSVDANMNIYRIQISKLLSAYDLAPANLPTFPLEKYQTPEKAAQALRKHWKIDKGPIFNLCAVVEKENVIIASLDFGTDRVDGRSMLADDGHPIIFTNKNQLGDRLRFTVAQQLGHLVMHTSGLSSFNENAGHEANIFAAEFLMPEKDILPDLKESAITIKRLAELKKKWRVSMQSIMYRAADLKIIDYNQTRYLETQFNQLKYRRREPMELDVKLETPAILKGIIIFFKTKKKYSGKELAKFVFLTEEEYNKRFIG